MDVLDIFLLVYCWIRLTRPIFGSPLRPPGHADDCEANDHPTSSPLNTHEIESLYPLLKRFCPGDSDELHYVCRDKSPAIRACKVDLCYNGYDPPVITEVRQDDGEAGVMPDGHGRFQLSKHVRNEDSANALYFCASDCTAEELARTTRYLETSTCRPCPMSQNARVSRMGRANSPVTVFKSIATAYPQNLSPPKDGELNATMPQQHIGLSVVVEGSKFAFILGGLLLFLAAGVWILKTRWGILFCMEPLGSSYPNYVQDGKGDQEPMIYKPYKTPNAVSVQIV
ncbi:hypothetical protein BV898_00221 [Hypsibius exemplaris]|uniref:Uncharacterized protein n=1 Tax=Hypsibius exemplaris TaxID=2072580 RepID=A0A1W0XF39_HYPEX|nr:hypothetical protein BV898_00221 [Hypsibius exemplaris]